MNAILSPPNPSPRYRQFTVAEYHRLIELGILSEEEKLELLEGFLVHKGSRNPPHEAALQLLLEAISRVLPAGWQVRIQSALSLADSEPEPDLAVVRGHARSYV